MTSALLEQSGEFSGAESTRLGATASPPPTFSPLTTTSSEELSDSYADLGASCDQDDLASLVSSLSGMVSFSDFFRNQTIIYNILLHNFVIMTTSGAAAEQAVCAAARALRPLKRVRMAQCTHSLDTCWSIKSNQKNASNTETA